MVLLLNMKRPQKSIQIGIQQDPGGIAAPRTLDLVNRFYMARLPET